MKEIYPRRIGVPINIVGARGSPVKNVVAWTAMNDWWLFQRWVYFASYSETWGDATVNSSTFLSCLKPIECEHDQIFEVYKWNL